MLSYIPELCLRHSFEFFIFLNVSLKHCFYTNNPRVSPGFGSLQFGVKMMEDDSGHMFRLYVK